MPGGDYGSKPLHGAAPVAQDHQPSIWHQSILPTQSHCRGVLRARAPASKRLVIVGAADGDQEQTYILRQHRQLGNGLSLSLISSCGEWAYRRLTIVG